MENEKESKSFINNNNVLYVYVFAFVVFGHNSCRAQNNPRSRNALSGVPDKNANQNCSAKTKELGLLQWLG